MSRCGRKVRWKVRAGGAANQIKRLAAEGICAAVVSLVVGMDVAMIIGRDG